MKEEKFYMVVTGCEFEIDTNENGEEEKIELEAITTTGIHTDIEKALKHYEKETKEVGKNDVTSVTLEEISTSNGIVLNSKVLFSYPEEKEGLN